MWAAAGTGTCIGIFLDSPTQGALGVQVLLDPLGPNGDRKFQPVAYDRGSDTALCLPVTEARADAVLLFDGVFLLRPELVDRWDLSIFMSATFERTLDRARTRGEALAGRAASTTGIERAWRNRYIPSQQLHFAAAQPTDHADIIVHNDELQWPAWGIRSS